MNLKVKNWFKSTGIGKLLRDTYQRRGFYSKKAAYQYVKRYLGEVDLLKMNELVSDMQHEAQKYNVGFDEYLMYHFYELSQDKRREFVPTHERIKYCEKLNNPKNMIIFDDKAKTYEYYKKYYKRDFANFQSGATLTEFEKFTRKHPVFIVKPYAGANGTGIQIVDSRSNNIATLFQSLNKQYKNGFYLEELVIQDEQLARFHPSSVNTLRLFTIRMNDRIEILPAAWRVGQGGKVVDNGGSGGIFCALDEQGVVYSTSDELGKSYVNHPTTGVQFIGFQIPKFEEAKTLARELANVIPSNRYTGWDLALTKTGWVMLEGNDRGGVVAFQLPMRKGCRKLLDDIMKELSL